MGFGMNLLFITCLLASVYNSHGCTMEGIAVWQLPITVGIEDYDYNEIILQRTFSGIGDYTLSSSTDLNGGPYIDVSMANSEFVLRTNDAFRLYEENETAQRITLTFTFTCTAGNIASTTLIVHVDINDNNNNDPLFKTPDSAASADTTYEFTIAPPVPPGFLITDCISDIIVRDVDLTTYRIDFGIEDNPFIAIEYDEAGSTVDKEFKAVLRTTSLIRTIPEPITLTISATDVDQTGDPPITRTTTVTIVGSAEFELPLEPVFSQAFYVAQYTDNSQITVQQSITLEQGYDEQVQFSLEGDYADSHITFNANGNLVTLLVTNPLPAEALQQGQIYLVVNAVREYTSGASATIVVQLPEVVALEFERPHYEGEIVDNTLQLTQLILSQGYQGSTVTVSIEGYSSFFTASVVGNIITLSMVPLEDYIIQENSFINLRVVASTDFSSATAIVTLEIVKEDVTTPVFGQPLYSGTYDLTAGLTVDPILLVQGYDETVDISLIPGEYESYFELVREGASSTLRVIGGGLPSHILSESQILLSVEAAKPRTVGARTVVSISLPGARELQFEASSYRGTLQNNILTLDNIILNVGYADDVTFSLSGDYSTSFGISNVQNQVTIYLPTPLPQEVISDNNFLMLTVTANALNALPTTTAVLLEIIKDDVTTPVFSQAIYYGTHLGSLDIENINLIQGYDNTVTFRIDGENSEYFAVTQNGNSLTLFMERSIPEEVIFNEKFFVFNIFADKPLTVGANAAISIKFSEDLIQPAVMQFSNNAYAGILEHNTLTLENIVLETGYDIGTQFLLSGEYASHFTQTVENNIVSLSIPGELPDEALENNRFIHLELEARRDRAVSAFTVIIIEIVHEEISVPVFNQAYYTGIYTEEDGLQSVETIYLEQGYDETVTFGLEGDAAAWFEVIQNANVATIVITSPITQEVLESHHQLLFTIVANKPNSINAHSAISIELPRDVLEQEVLRFTQSSYEGRLDGYELQTPTIALSNEIIDNVLLSSSGTYATYFTVTLNSNIVTVELTTDLPADIISENDFIVLDIVASKPEAVSGYTALVLHIVKEPPIITPVFEEAYYTGEISEQGGLVFEHTIRLIQGYDESVSFSLDGDGSERFLLTQAGNSLSLSFIEGGVQIENISHLVFSVVASKSGSVPGVAAIVIYNSDSSTSRSLRFSQNHYRGSLEENILQVESINIVEGYSSDVDLTLIGDYANYFLLVGQDGTYSLQLLSGIPGEVIEANSVLVFSIEASVDNTRAHATVIVELMKNNDISEETLTFEETYYVSSYSATTGVMADIQMRVVSGYDSGTQFTLEGGYGAWFSIQHSESIVTLSLVTPLPAAIFINNQPLIFALNAINPSGSTASTTIVVTLEDELPELTVLGFERNNYIGTIDTAASTLEPIVLNQGYSSEVQFTLHGDLANYFSINRQDATVNILLQNAISEETISANRIIVLDLQATANQAISATTTIVFEVVNDEELAFSATHYIGRYSETEGLDFNSVISLDTGYDEQVVFTLEGDHAQWFALQASGNSVTLTLSGAIPPAILVNYHQLVFGVTAQKPNSNNARTTIIISLVEDLTDAAILGFERASYLGSIENNLLSIESIILSEGYTEEVAFTLHGELVSYFSLQQQASTVNILLSSVIPEQALPTNGLVFLEVRASAPQAIPATTTIILETQRGVVGDELIFSATHYIGQYSETGGLEFNSAISLDTGYDEQVEFALEGDHAQWFTLQEQGNSVTVTLSGAIPPAILVNNHQLIFSVIAKRPNSNTARATIVISLVEDFNDATALGFERASYLGSIENNVLSIEPIVLNEGYSNDVSFSLYGDFAAYFILQQQESTVNILLQNAIPEQALPANGLVLLEVRASAPQAIPATTTIILETQHGVVGDELIFSATHYIGQYSETGGLDFNSAISLDTGYDEQVEFALEGDHAQWFTLQEQGNSVTVTLSGAIPPAILVNNHQLIFSVIAKRPNSNTARATIVISLVEDFNDATALGFERASYLGSIENNVLSIEPIVLNEGYSNDVSFSLYGDFAAYFILQQQESTVNILLQNAIPEQALPANGLVLLEVRASAPQAIPATTTIILETQRVVVGDELIFSATHYIGQYSETGGLEFNSAISLDTGYDEQVEFALEGDHAQWFTLQEQGNSITLTLSGAIPPAILVNNHQLIFSVIAQRPNSNTARATIVISLVEDFTDATALGFERASYLGSIENNVLSIEPIVLNEGYTNDVSFSLYGDFAAYFILQQQESTVNILLQNAIPEQALPANGLVLLEVRASAPQAIPATTTIILETQRVVVGDELIFSATHYIGQYSETGGLEFNSAISLDTGYDEQVEFALEGDHAQWFTLQEQGNSITLTLSGAIPPAILVNNHQLIFSVIAQRPNSNTARATIVISLVEDFTDATALGFERASYLGSIENNVLSIEPIVLNEGYTNDVTFSLYGDLAAYFILQQQESTVNILLQNAIPEQALPANGLVLLEVRASAPQAIPATTTIILETQRVVVGDELIFSATHYIGQYSETGGLEFNSAISLDTGYDEQVEFALEGDHAQWFTLQEQGNSITLTLSGAIPPAILVNNHQLIFSVIAQRPNSNTARATIVISLVEDFTDATALGFERASYLGSIENNVLSIEPIVLNEGYTNDVTFSLYGDLAAYFILQQQESTVNILLQNAIPEQALPANGLVLLEVRASAPQVIPATTTIILETQRVVVGDELIFSATHYIGQYSETGGLEFNSAISLDTGYDEQVEFALEGDHAQWFTLQEQGNSVTLTLSGAVPPAILVNNHQLIFSVIAQRPNSNTARATIVISLVEDFTDATALLGFERASYLGSIENNVLSIEPIVLNEGYTNDVSFSLYGDFAAYFILQQQESTVNILLQNAIPEQALPANGLVLLEVRASAPQAIPATTTIILETQRVVVGDELIFSATHYIGQYSETGGLEFNSAISLDTGYDEQVEFALEGDHAQWFTLQEQGNSVTLTLSGAIPPAILVNNHQLIFSVIAQRPNSNTARATIVISLVEDFTDATALLGFERASYLGSIENNVLSIEPIVLNEGYTNDVSFSLYGDFAAYFILQQQESTVNILLQNAIPEQALPANGLVLLEVRASAPQAIPATTTIILETQRVVVGDELVFSATHYIGQYSETGGLEFNSVISLDVGYDENVEFTLEGDHSLWFALQVQENSITIIITSPIPPSVLVNNHQLVFIVTAQTPNSNRATATIVISLVEDFTDATVLGFERASYLGSIENDVLGIEPIVLTEGYSNEVSFTLHGDIASYFNLQQQESTVSILLQNAIPDEALPANRLVLLEVRASAPQAIPATATVVLEAQRTDVEEELSFSAAYYTGDYSETESLDFNTVISLEIGYGADVEFTLEGEFAQWFDLSDNENSITLVLVEPVPPSMLADVRKIIMTVRAARPNSNIARAVIIISVINDSGSETNVAFDKVLYEGTVNLNVVQHEPITITGYTGADVEILGVYRDLFSATVSGDTVVVGASSTLGFPESVTHVALELRADGASAVLIFDVIQSETPELPTVAFESPSYLLRADVSQTGLLGLVRASASNGETVAYSLDVDNAHLQARVWINSEGEIHLSEFANTGVYNFQVIATSVITQVQGLATVQLTIEATITCGDDHMLPPLIILDRDEEQPHTNLVVLDNVNQSGCQYRLNNRWPLDQNWLYVDETGLHTVSIDREDPRIAFMALSQVQVELILECDSDTQSRVKRSTNTSPRLDWLGPYDYGSNKWILTDSISYNSRRSFVNLIVNDINDNYPIFVGKENEPIVYGYPIPELEEIVLPRALAELKATDADVGGNAALSFWTPEDVLAVAPTTGSVHVRNGATLTQDQLLTVSVTDLNGREDGLTGSIQLKVKLIDSSHIAVVTVRNAFLDEEQTILDNLSSAVGYEVKVLSSAVISDDPEDSQNTRNKRDVTSEGASLQLYVYGIIDRKPVAVDQLTNDITANVLPGVDVTSTLSLEDYLEGREIYISGGRDTGLLVATIVLSVLLFILILAIAVCFFLRWRKARNYEQFSDATSLASRNEPLEQPPKVDTLNKPRLNIEELKKSERRLQEMLDAPIDKVTPKASTSQADPEVAFDTLINIPPTDTTLPIVIQSIDKLKDDVTSDEDEFGERTKKDRRKSVVTFNENVEKIIHVEDIPDDNSSDVEVFKF